MKKRCEELRVIVPKKIEIRMIGRRRRRRREERVYMYKSW